jgi:probable HAF family extracellular repeat protein
MKSRTLTCISAVSLFAVLAISVRLPAQEQPAVQGENAQHTRYKLIDIGTLGGPSGFGNGNGYGDQLLNNAGAVAGSADTSTPDPTCANPDCFVSHAFRWQNGVLTDLGALPGVNGSNASAINTRGWIAGFSQNGEIDPLTGGPGGHAVLWKNGEIIDLGTLGTGIESNAVYVNNGGQVVGFSTVNAILDPSGFSFLGAATHAFIWENGVMRDLGTLGGPDSIAAAGMAGCANERNGLVAGGSFTNSTPNPTTGIPTMDPFLWEDGTMTDLGTLGGTFGFAQCANNRGQVTGQSNLAGDSTAHPFFWDHGVLTDMGTFGGDNGTPNWINDAGDVVGAADLPGSQVHHAFLWRNGTLADLGTLGTNSQAFAINSEGQIVGRSKVQSKTFHAFLWEKGGPMIDLNTLIPANSSLQLEEAFDINDRGEISGLGAPPGVLPVPDGVGLHPFLLIPCDAGETQGCEDNAVGTPAVAQTNPAPVVQRPTTATQEAPAPNKRMASFRERLASRYHIPSAGAPRD